MARGERLSIEAAQSVIRARELLSGEQWRAIALALRLSRREFDVVQCVFDGYSEDTIAHALGISTSTVHTYMDRLHRKLRVNTRSDLILRIFAEYVSQGQRKPAVERAGAKPPTTASATARRRPEAGSGYPPMP